MSTSVRASSQGSLVVRMTEADLILREILREFGVKPAQEAKALAQVRASVVGPFANPKLAQIPLYVRFQRARRGDLVAPCAAPDVPLYDLDGKETSLLAQASPDRPLLVVAGSWS